MEPENERSSKRVYLAFVSLAVLAGPLTGYLAGTALPAIGLGAFTGVALSSAVAGIVLIALSVSHRQRILAARQWLALLLLLIPQWCSVALSPLITPLPWLHGIRWGTSLLLSLAAPLWLALLSALEMVRVEVPRSIVAAAIAGIGAVCLVVPVDAYSIAWSQVPMLFLQILLGIAAVASWVFARDRLNGAPPESAAGCFLLLSAAGNAVFALLFERELWAPLEWRELIAPLALQAVVVACSWVLWFWLLQRVTVGAFGMRALAAWLAAVIPGVAAFGFLQWRADAAIVVALIAIVVSLRAAPVEEQPVALGLGGP
jgi:drug/metabolite transporter (DMT)-like permease